MSATHGDSCDNPFSFGDLLLYRQL
jgi:hypothetical protein